MIGKAERNDRMYKILLWRIVSFAFIRARYSKKKCIMLQRMYDKFPNMNRSDVVSFMDEPVMKEIFAREITGEGIVYRLTGRFRYAEFDAVNKLLNERLKKNKVEKK